MENTPLIFDIRHFSLDDGPGIRTTVFLKGCPLSCKWCHNPEGINRNREIVFYPEKCIGCGNCKSVCPDKAIVMGKGKRILTDRCNLCGLCALECPANALRMIGKYYSPGELVKILLSDRLFYQTSSGGVTFSGGEPTLFMDYLNIIFGMLKENNIHIAIQTSGAFDFKEFKEKLMPFLDLVYFDLKLIDNIEYHRWTGGDVIRSLENFRQLCEQTGVRVIASIPLIPGITSTIENLLAVKKYLEESGCREWIFRPYHPGGKAKNISHGKKAPDLISGNGLSIRQEQMAKRIFYGEKEKECRS
jgi:pyruvate formate lyase activating enzyme